MTRQATRDARTLARSCDPITSIKAAEQAAGGMVDSHENRIRLALRQIHTGTAEEIGDACGLDKVQVGKRLPYMCDLEPVVNDDGAEVTRKMRDGRAARVWGAK